MDLAVILVVIFVFVLLKNLLEQRAKGRRERAHLLELALQQPHLDRATLDDLTWRLTGRRNKAADAQASGRRWRSLILAAGWFTLFAGGAICVLGSIAGTRHMLATGVAVAILGFAVTTYPFALRELEARRGD